MRPNLELLLLLVVLVVASVVLGMLLAYRVLSGQNQVPWQAAAIRNNAAHYDAKNGDFMWNEEVKP